MIPPAWRRGWERFCLEMRGGFATRRAAKTAWKRMDKRLRLAMGRLELVDDSLLESPLLPFVLENLAWRRRGRGGARGGVLPPLRSGQGDTLRQGDLRFSVVVNTVNRAQTLGETLEGLRRLDYPSYEVIVVRGPCNDETDQVLEPYQKLYRIIDCPVLNLSTSRNLGIRAAAGDVVAFIDDDAVPHPRWLRELALAYQDPRVGAAGGPIFDRSGIRLQCRFTLADRLGQGVAFFEEEQLEGWADFLGAPGAYHFLTLTGTNCSFRREVLVALGGFDEHFGFFLEETDLCLRVMDAGFQIAAAKDALVYHKYAPSHLRDANNVQRDFTTIFGSITYFYLRHGTPFWGVEGIEERLRVRLEKHERDMRFKHVDGRISDEELKQILLSTEAGVAAGRRAASSAENANSPWIDESSPCSNFLEVPHLSQGNRRKRFVLLSAEYAPQQAGGIARYTEALAEGLAARGHDVQVIARATADLPESLVFRKGVWVHRVAAVESGFPPLPAEFPLPVCHARWAFPVYLKVKALAAEVAVDQVFAPLWNFPGLYCLLDEDIPTVSTLHTPYLIAKHYKPQWSDRKERLNPTVSGLIACEESLLRGAYPKIANSEFILKAIGDELGATIRARVVPHGLSANVTGLIDDEALPPGSSNEILCVGRFEARKGIDLLVRAIPLLFEAVPSARVRLIGKTDFGQAEPEWWKQFLEILRERNWTERITVEGEVSEAILWRRYTEARAVVCPSRFESFGLTVIEAMRAGRPVVAFRNGGADEQIIDRQTGLIVSDFEPTSLATALIDLATQADFANELGANAAKTFQSAYTSTRMAEAMEAI